MVTTQLPRLVAKIINQNLFFFISSIPVLQIHYGVLQTIIEILFYFLKSQRKVCSENSASRIMCCRGTPNEFQW